MIDNNANVVSAMQVSYQNCDYSISHLQVNIEEAYFDRQEVLKLLNTLDSQYVKVALALVPAKDLNLVVKPENQITMIMLGVDASGNVPVGSQGLVSTIPCPPICRQKASKPKIIVSV